MYLGWVTQIRIIGSVTGVFLTLVAIYVSGIMTHDYDSLLAIELMVSGMYSKDLRGDTNFQKFLNFRFLIFYR